MSGLRDRLQRHRSAITGHAGAADGGVREEAAEPQWDADGSEGTQAVNSIRAGDAVNNEEAVAVDDRVGEGSKHKGPAAAADDPWSALQGELLQTPGGTFIRRRRVYSAEYRHGYYRLGQLAECRRSGLFDGTVANGGEAFPESVLFFDTETTGLGVGAGNLPFMLGIGFYEAGSFVVEQLIIRNAAEEAAMLSYFAEKLTRFRHVASYNGRTFDWPIIRNRFVLSRMTLSEESLAQVDFLYPSRSLWRKVLPTCRLGQVETDRLGFVREDDIPGSMAPELYFRFLAEGDPMILAGLLLHNEHDILSLAALAVHFSYLLEGQLSFEEMEDEELFRIGLWLDKRGRSEMACEAFDCLLAREPGEDADAANYRLEIAAFFKKRGDYARSVRLWSEVTERGGDSPLQPIEPYVELAIYYEHRAKQLEPARQATEAALAIVRKRSELARRAGGRRAVEAAKTNRKLTEELEKRLARLVKKAEREVPDLFGGMQLFGAGEHSP